MTKEEAIKVLEAEKKFLFHGSLSDKHYETAFDMAIEALQQKTGKWIEIDMNEYKAKCSSCGTWSPIMGNYCPNCGAKMEEEQ